ncbi:MAG: hypothetical protein HYW22_01190 [Candidatus Aenigmarchaeota archaeon]|nr:hypothetical protein [Candidatus Aenigmarchaeota archaeon]
MSIHNDRIDILYNFPEYGSLPVTEESVNSRSEWLSERLQREVKIKLLRDQAEFFHELSTNPYQVVIMHMGGGRINAYDLAKRCRGVTGAFLVVESVIYGPYCGLFGPELNDGDETDPVARKYFDAYMGVPDYEDFEKLLRKMGLG